MVLSAPQSVAASEASVHSWTPNLPATRSPFGAPGMPWSGRGGAIKWPHPQGHRGNLAVAVVCGRLSRPRTWVDEYG